MEFGGNLNLYSRAMITKNVPRINSLVPFTMRPVIFTSTERREEGKEDEREEKENSKIQRE